MSAAEARDLRLWLQVFGACVAVALVLLLWTLFTPPSQGDLTRIGRLSETAFGPTRPMPETDPALRVSSALDEADLVVIGDSFSAPLRWQAVLVAQGHKVATVHWDQLGPVCADLEPLLRAQGYRGRTVVIESVERMLVERLDRSEACTARRDTTPLSTRRVAQDPRNAGPFGLNSRETLFTGLLTTLHTRRATAADAPAEIVNRGNGAEEVRIQAVPDGCERFSHRACHRGLFFAQDRTAPPFTPDLVERMQRLSARHPGLSITWLVLPNKSSVYLQPERSATVGAALETTGLGPDLFADFVRQSRQRRDFYLPNDTHTSADGHRALGKRVQAWLAAQAAAATTAPPMQTTP